MYFVLKKTFISQTVQSHEEEEGKEIKIFEKKNFICGDNDDYDDYQTLNK